MTDKNIFGVDKEKVEKSKNILPTFKLGSLNVGDSVVFSVLSEKPEGVEHEDHFNKGKKVTTDTLKIAVEKVIRDDGTEVIIGEKNTLWLSSESLKLGLSTALSENDDNLLGLKVRVSVSLANYEQGENRCYNVTKL